jgi:2-keto-4-pentenoate hydratase/2-oxohepta-3-ene-1,7-dioic acid hydratase in catechol pathway
MKLARFSDPHAARYGIVEGASIRPLPETMSALPVHEVIAIVRDNPNLAERPRPLSEIRLLAPLPRPGKVVAIGLNYADHASEGQLELPSEPLVLAKFPSSIIGPDEPIRWNRAVTDAVDLEAELAAIIGVSARHVSPDRALDYVIGYTCLNDVTARDLQFRDGQWVRGKSLDTFCPIGPWIVTTDELPDPQVLGIRSWISGRALQDGSTGDMLFSVAEIVARLSQALTLEPGDVIATGTPPGVGWFRDPRQLLADGDDVVVEIDGIGRLRNPVIVTGDEPGALAPIV